ncbi:MAG: 23S rRNA (guanosine2251-2'-O)-methyltransferase [Candidatus Deianiraeaceae bacterium]|jgi:23S rRNA (guanosine2251-2'-O)-methyltransferase
MGDITIYGKHAVLLACKKRNQNDITTVFIVEKQSLDLIPKTLHGKVKITTVTALNKVSPMHNGFVCITSAVKEIHEHELLSMKKIIALDGVHDVGNIGAILRSAVAFGVDAVIYTKDKMPDIANNPAIAKLSSGGIELIKLCKVVNLDRTLSNLQKEGFWVIGTDANGESITHISQQFQSSKSIVVFGNEENGIKPSIRKTCDVFAAININTQIGSLNVSAAAAIIMWKMFGKDK